MTLLLRVKLPNQHSQFRARRALTPEGCDSVQCTALAPKYGSPMTKILNATSVQQIFSVRKSLVHTCNSNLDLILIIIALHKCTNTALTMGFLDTKYIIQLDW